MDSTFKLILLVFMLIMWAVSSAKKKKQDKLDYIAQIEKERAAYGSKMSEARKEILSWKFY